MALIRERQSIIPAKNQSTAMPLASHFSVLSSSVLMIAKAIDSYGHDSRELFYRAGLDHDRLTQPLARFSYAAIQRLWQIALETTGDPCFGLRVASFWHPTTFHALGYSWLASRNLEEAFERLVRYSSVVSTAAKGAMRIEKSRQSFCLVVDIDHVNPPPAPVAIDAGMAAILAMCRGAYGDRFRPLEVQMRHPESRCVDQFVELFRAPVRFSQPRYSMCIDPGVASESLATANPELVRVNDQVVTDYLVRLDREDIIMRVRSKLIERLSSGQVDEADIASSVNLSRRSLQRKLRQRGVSFSELLDSSRRELGLKYVRDAQYSLNEVAFLLGFAEPGNFSRAFRRWFGKSPSQYRHDSLLN
jgi:AraC-like DNA-binding protein